MKNARNVLTTHTTNLLLICYLMSLQLLEFAGYSLLDAHNVLSCRAEHSMGAIGDKLWSNHVCDALLPVAVDASLLAPHCTQGSVQNSVHVPAIAAACTQPSWKSALHVETNDEVIMNIAALALMHFVLEISDVNCHMLQSLTSAPYHRRSFSVYRIYIALYEFAKMRSAILRILFLQTPSSR